MSTVKMAAKFEILSPNRFGVVRGLGKMVKDCYIIALPKEGSIHPVILPLDGAGLDEDR